MGKEEHENFIRKRVLTSKGKKNTKESIVTIQAPRDVDFLERLFIVGKNNCKCWACR